MCKFNCNQGNCKTGAPHYCSECGAFDQHRKKDCPKLKTPTIVICTPVNTSAVPVAVCIASIKSCGVNGCTEQHDTHHCRNCNATNKHMTTKCDKPCKSCGRVTNETARPECKSINLHIQKYN